LAAHQWQNDLDLSAIKEASGIEHPSSRG